MGNRPPDRIRLECEAGTLDRFNSLEITNDISGPSEASFDIGDDGSWPTLADVVAHGKPFKVWLNDRLRLTGRAYANEVPTDASEGTSVNVTVRTILADAHYASAETWVRVQNVSIKDFLLQLYAPLGVGASAFVFNADVERDLMTGVGAKGAAAPANLDPIKLDQAKVNPPESIYDAAAKHLKRFGLMHWDTPGGKIYVGAPDDTQQPVYRLICKRGTRGQGNNVLTCRRVADWSDVPSEVRLYGGTGSKDVAKAPLKAIAGHPDVQKAGFYRPVILVNEAAKAGAQLDAQSLRERATRSLRKDAFEVTVDSWGYWDGSSSTTIPWATNTTVDVDVDAVGGPLGLYYIHRVGCRYDAGGAPLASLSLVGQGILSLAVG